MEIDSGIEGLPLLEPKHVLKRKWDPDMELMWEEKAVLVLDICREQLDPKGCNVVPASFFDLTKECEVPSSRAVREQSTSGSNKTFDDPMDDVGIRVFEDRFKKGLHVSESDPPRNDELSDDDKLEALHLVRCKELTDYDPKYGWETCTRFCRFNISLFDHDEESKVGLGQPLSELTPRDLITLDPSVNVVSLKIVEPDRRIRHRDREG